jgi:hypothetical protein
MADEKPNRRDPDWLRQDDDLGLDLDAVLAQYAAAEPRVGLEERILANLRAERSHVPDRTWWRWAIAGALAAVIIVGVTLAWRSAKPSQPTVANRPQPSLHESLKPGTEVTVQDNTATQPHAHTPIRRATVHPPRTVVGEKSPKLDQFPSPQPLSEQEKLLASYVNQYPEHASLIAQARMEALRRDQEEERREAGANSMQGSQPQ